TGECALMHLIRSIYQVHDAAVYPHRSQWEVIAHSATTKHLDGPVEYIGMYFGCHNLNHRDLFLSSLFTLLVDDPGRLKRQQTRLFDLQLRLSNPLLSDTLFR